MTVELCYPCSQLIEQLNLTDKEQGCAECGVKTSDGYALYCVKCSEPLREWAVLKNELDVSKVTRLEVIDENGRSYVKYHISDVKFSLQDDDRTLKIFLEVQTKSIK